MGVGYASGDGRSVAAARAAISSPLLEASIEGARGILLNVSGPSDLGLFELHEAAEIIGQAGHADSNIIFGAVIDDSLGDEVRITVIAAGFDRYEGESKNVRSGSASARPRRRGLTRRRGSTRPRRRRLRRSRILAVMLATPWSDPRRCGAAGCCPATSAIMSATILSSLRGNRAALAAVAGLPAPDQWVWLRQVHGPDVLTVESPDARRRAARGGCRGHGDAGIAACRRHGRLRAGCARRGSRARSGARGTSWIGRWRHRSRGGSSARARDLRPSRVPRAVHRSRALRVRRGRPRRARAAVRPESRGAHATTAGACSTSRAGVRIALRACRCRRLRRLAARHVRRRRSTSRTGATVKRAGKSRWRCCRDRRRRSGRRALTHRARRERGRSGSVRGDARGGVEDGRTRRDSRGPRGGRHGSRREPRPGSASPKRSSSRATSLRRDGISSVGLQRNKVRSIAPHVALWQSVDRDELVREIAQHAPGRGGARAGECGG